MDALFAREGELQDIIDATDAWNLDSQVGIVQWMLSLSRLEDQPVENLSGSERRQWPLPFVAAETGCFAGRTYQPLDAESILTGWNNIYNNMKVRTCDARPLLPRSRCRMDS